MPVFKRTLVEDLSVPGQRVLGAATVYSLGALGCGLRTMEAFRPGSRVRITFYDDNEDNPLSLIGRVVYANPERVESYYSYGVAFEQIEEGRGNLTNALLDMLLRATGHKLCLL